MTDHTGWPASGLPQRLVFIDVNGTLLAHDAAAPDIPARDIEAFRWAVRCAELAGWTVGLCSDSPVLPLRALAKRLGLADAALIIAENGSVLAIGDKPPVLIRPLPGHHRSAHGGGTYCDGAGAATGERCRRAGIRWTPARRQVYMGVRSRA